MEFINELKKLGLADKEAAVYLACLELGPSSAQRISRTSDVVRATTYVILESLIEKGLVTTYKVGKKTLFAAEPPRQLVRLLEKEHEAINEKQKHLEEMLQELQVLMKAAGGRPSVRYFEGKEGLHAIRQEIVMYSQPGDVIYNFTPIDYLVAIFPENESVYRKQLVAKGIYSRTIFTTRSADLRKSMLAQSAEQKVERQYIPPELFSSNSGMTVFRDRIAMGTFTGRQMGVIIESEPMVLMMKQLFELAWRGAALIKQ